jgi:hypothetical protein
VRPGPAASRIDNTTPNRRRDMKGGDLQPPLAVMREEEKRSARRVREGLKLGGLITAGVGVALYSFLQGIVPDMPVYLAALIPMMVVAAMLAYAYVLAPHND